MARLTSEFTFTGPLGNLSAYRVKGSDHILLRRKGGASKKQIKEAPQFETTRRLNAEFAGRAALCKRILQGLFPLKALADYNMGGAINAILKPVQEKDAVSEFGKRNILLSHYPRLIEGFSFNRISRMESMVGSPVSASIMKEQNTAKVELPEIIPGINFRMTQYPVYSFITVIAAVPDLFWSEDGYVPSHPSYDHLNSTYATTEWFSCLKGSASQTLNVSLAVSPPDTNHALVLGVGISFGMLHDLDTIRQVRYGCAKIAGAI